MARVRRFFPFGIVLSISALFMMAQIGTNRDVLGQALLTPASKLVAPVSTPEAGDAFPAVVSGQADPASRFLLDTSTLASEPARIESCPELCDYPDIQDGRVVYEDHRGPGIEVYGTDLNTDREFMVIHDTPHQHFPVIYDDIVVYTDLRYSTQGLDGTDVFAMNLSTGEEMTVTTAPGQQINLAIGPRYIVWEDDRAGSTGTDEGSNRDIYAYDMETGNSFAVATGPATQLHPAIDGSRVVWSENGDIVGRDLATGTNFIISTHWANQLRPAIQGDLVVWEDWRNGNWDIYGYRFSTGEEFPIAQAPDDQNFVDISEALIVWQDHRHGNWDIYVHDIETGAQFTVSRNARKQKWPAVDGKTVVWSDFRELEPHIYGFTYDGTIPEGVVFDIENNPTDLVIGAFPDGVIKLTWQDNTQTESQYIVERHTGMLGTDYEIVATLPADTEVYTDTDTAVNAVYWYRVYAVNDQGRSATSNESYNVALPAAPYPSEQERYMQVLINEVRADPAKFGYPGYSPQPPVVFDINLNYAARAHATATVLPGSSGGHVDWADRGPGERAVASGYEHIYVSENMFAAGTPSAESVAAINRGFLGSYGHRDNMLVAGETETGLGFFFLPGIGGAWVETFAGQSGLAIPALPAGAVSPFRAKINDTFTYTVNYYNPDGYPPSLARVVIDGVAHELSLSTGTSGNATYRYSTTLDSVGAHSYYFEFTSASGSARLPQTGTFVGPQVLDDGVYDLRLFSVELPGSSLLLGGQTDVTFWVNNSSSSTMGDVMFALYVGNPQLSGARVVEQRLDVRSGYSPVTLPWAPQLAGNYELYAVVDPDDEIIEVDEWNNVSSTAVTVIDTGTFDYSVLLPLVTE